MIMINFVMRAARSCEDRIRGAILYMWKCSYESVKQIIWKCIGSGQSKIAKKKHEIKVQLADN